jgi:hypothetical protein
MGVAYAPFDSGPGPGERPAARAPVFDPLRLSTQAHSDTTECNYLVMFFVIGVFAIALVDGLKSTK